MKDVSRENVGKKLATVAQKYPEGKGYNWGTGPILEELSDIDLETILTEKLKNIVDEYG